MVSHAASVISAAPLLPGRCEMFRDAEQPRNPHGADQDANKTFLVLWLACCNICVMLCPGVLACKSPSHLLIAGRGLLCYDLMQILA